MTPASVEDTPGTVVVGGGAGGCLVAIRLLMDPRRSGPVTVVEPDGQLGRGAAYSTTRPEHLLNVVASRMSALPEQPDHFLRFLADGDEGRMPDLADGFAARRDYARYLQSTLEALPDRGALVHLRDRVVDIQRDTEGFSLRLASGGRLSAREVVLALGNAPRPLPEYLRHPGMRLVDAWHYEGTAQIEADASVCIIGSGLSMVDAALSLEANGHRGPIHVLSRHGLMPLPHAATGPQHGHAVDDLLPLGVRERWRVLRRRVQAAAASGEPWQWSFDRLRHHGQALWRSLDDTQRRRFLRHAVRYWDIHRHRIAPQVAATLDALRARGQLRIVAGRLQSIAPAPEGGSHLHFALRHSSRCDSLQADWIVNATGVETRIDLRPGELVPALRERGLVLPGPQGLGVASDDDGRVFDAHGLADPGLYVLGALRIGDLWESIAIPELREQARRIAGHILDTRAAAVGEG